MPNRTRSGKGGDPSRNRGVIRSDFSEPRRPGDGDVVLPNTGTDLQEAAIGTRGVEPGSLTSQKLAHRDQANIIPDPGFEEEPSRLALTDGWAPDSATVYEGLWSSTATSNGAQKRFIILTGVPIVATEKVLLSAAFRVASGTSAGAGTNPRLGVIWRNSAGASLSESYVDEGTYDATWRVREAIVAAPSNAVTFDLYQELPAAMTTSKATYIDARICRKMLIFKSALSGARGELDLNGLRAYNSGGSNTVNIDFSNGNAAFTGTVSGSTITGSTVRVDGLLGNNYDALLKDGIGLRFTQNDNENKVSSVEANLVNDVNNYTSYMNLIDYEDTAIYNAGSTVLGRTEIELYRNHAKSGGLKTSRISLIGRGGGTTTHEARIELTGKSDGVHKAHIWGDQRPALLLETDPSDSDVGNSSYSAGAKGSSWRVDATTNFTATSGTTEKTLLTLSNVPLIKGRRYELKGFLSRYQGTVNGDNFELRLKDGGGALENLLLTCIETTNRSQGGFVEIDYVPASTGNVTFTLTITRVLGTGTATVHAAAVYPCYLRIQDVGY